MESAAHHECARADQRGISSPHEDTGQSAQPGRRSVVALRLTAQRPGKDAKDRWVARDGVRETGRVTLDGDQRSDDDALTLFHHLTDTARTRRRGSLRRKK